MRIKDLNGVKIQVDENDFPYLTNDNFEAINNAIKNDDKYKKQFFESECSNEEKKSEIFARDYIKNHWKNYEKADNVTKMNILSNILYRIDYENSTHLSGSIGIVKLVENLKQKENLYNAIKDPQSGIGLIDSVAQTKDENGKQRYYKSIVSKFFTYVNRYGYEETNDGYSIVDKILVISLPYYLEKISKDKVTEYKNNLSNRSTTGRIIVKDYEKYCKHIGVITEKCKISREKIDRILWYYFRKDSSREEDFHEKAINKYQELIINR